MALILTANETEFAPCPSGSHHATCIRIIDLGTQRIEYNGEVKTQPKILIQWEILSQNDPDMQMSDGRPYIISRRYTASMHSKSQLANDLKSWRGRDFSPEERAGFDIRNVLGKTCLLSVSHEQSKDGQRTYANIAGIANKLKAFEPPPPANEVFAFDLSHPDWQAFDKLHEKIQEQIKASPEYAELSRPAHTPPLPPTAQVAVPSPAAPQHRPNTRPAAPSDNLDDDIPF